MMRSALFLMVLLCCASASAQTVYKCTDERGTVVFSQRPCAQDPNSVQTVDVSRSMKTGSGGSVAEQGEFAKMNEVRRRCEARTKAVTQRYAESFDRLAAEITVLEARMSAASDTAADATREAAVRQQISGLVAERGTLKSAEVQEQADNRKQCRDEERDEADRQATLRSARDGSDALAKGQADAKAKQKAQDKAKADNGLVAPLPPVPTADPKLEKDLGG